MPSLANRKSRKTPKAAAIVSNPFTKAMKEGQSSGEGFCRVSSTKRANSAKSRTQSDEQGRQSTIKRATETYALALRDGTVADRTKALSDLRAGREGQRGGLLHDEGPPPNNSSTSPSIAASRKSSPSIPLERIARGDIDKADPSVSSSCMRRCMRPAQNGREPAQGAKASGY